MAIHPFTKIAFKCGVEGCEFGHPNKDITEVHDLEALTEADGNLLNLLLDTAPEKLAPEQVQRLNILLNGRLECPNHGRQNLGYVGTETVTVTAAFILNIDEEEADEDGWPDGIVEI